MKTNECKLEFKIKQCELGGIHIYQNEEFIDCIDRTRKWEWNKFYGHNVDVAKFPNIDSSERSMF